MYHHNRANKNVVLYSHNICLHQLATVAWLIYITPSSSVRLNNADVHRKVTQVTVFVAYGKPSGMAYSVVVVWIARLYHTFYYLFWPCIVTDKSAHHMKRIYSSNVENLKLCIWVKFIYYLLHVHTRRGFLFCLLIFGFGFLYLLR